MVTPGSATRRAPALLPAFVVLVIEAAGAIAFGIGEALQINPDRLVVGLGSALLLLGYGIFLLLVGWAVRNGRRWSRGPGVATQLLQLPIAWSFLDGRTWWVGAVLGIAAIVVLVCLVLPSSTAALTDKETEPDPKKSKAEGEL